MSAAEARKRVCPRILGRTLRTGARGEYREYTLGAFEVRSLCVPIGTRDSL